MTTATAKKIRANEEEELVKYEADTVSREAERQST